MDGSKTGMDQVIVIGGVGPGLGEALARRFVNGGYAVGLFARTESYLDELAAELGDAALGVPVDITDHVAVTNGFETVRDEFGPVSVLVNHASGAAWKGIRDIARSEFMGALEVGPLGALNCTKCAVPDMLEQNEGTIIFTGATSAVRGRDGAVGFSAAKFACRGMAESLARELGPAGIHVAHVIIDGQIHRGASNSESPALEPDAIADSYWHLVEQDPSSWTLELDLRPHNEPF